LKQGGPWVRGNLSASEARIAAFAAHAAARDADDPLVRAAARAAGHAAATAHVAGYSRHAADTIDADAAAAKEYAGQVRRLPEHLRSVVYPPTSPPLMARP